MATPDPLLLRDLDMALSQVHGQLGDSLRGDECSGTPTWKRLISRELTTHKRISLITTIFSEDIEIWIVQSLCGDDAQAFTDVADEVLSHTLPSPWAR